MELSKQGAGGRLDMDEVHEKGGKIFVQLMRTGSGGVNVGKHSNLFEHYPLLRFEVFVVGGSMTSYFLELG